MRDEQLLPTPEPSMASSNSPLLDKERMMGIR